MWHHPKFGLGRRWCGTNTGDKVPSGRSSISPESKLYTFTISIWLKYWYLLQGRAQGTPALHWHGTSPWCHMLSKESYFPSQASIAGCYSPIYNTVRYVQQTSLYLTFDPNTSELSLACSPDCHLLVFWTSSAASAFHTWCQRQLHPVLTYECPCLCQMLL